jgi:hypothetical protein
MNSPVTVSHEKPQQLGVSSPTPFVCARFRRLLRAAIIALGGRVIKTIAAIALAIALGACTYGQPANPTSGGVQGGSTGAAIGCVVTIPIGCVPGAVVGAAAGGALGATGNAIAIPPKTSPPGATTAYPPS